METFNEDMTKDKIVASPQDQVLEGMIVVIEKGLLKEFLDPSVHSAFDNLDQPTLKVYFECKFNDRVIKGNDRIAYYEDPMSNSTLGKFLAKYDKIKVGVEIKVLYNKDGFGKIVV